MTEKIDREKRDTLCGKNGRRHHHHHHHHHPKSSRLIITHVSFKKWRVATHTTTTTQNLKNKIKCLAARFFENKRFPAF
jgi:hypothetical protein